jgi:tetratricopeptide (TPR) repeat protein
VAYLLAWPAAILSKENGVLLPAFLLLMEFYWYGFEGRRNTVLFFKGLHFVFCIVPFFVALVWIAMHIDSLRATYSSRNFSLGERLLTETRVMWDYVRQLFLPRGIEMGITHDDFEISRGLFRPIATIAAVLAWAGVLFSIIRWRRNATFGPLAFGMAFFIVGHILECTVFPLELYFEHRNYLPSMGLFLGAVLTAAAALQQFRNLARLAPLVVLLPVATGFITYQRVITWQSPEAIARMAEYAHPNSSRLQTALISMYVRDGKLDKTRAAIARLQEIDGGRSVVHALLELESDCHLEHKPLEEEYKAIISTTRFSGDIVSLHTRVEALANLLVGRGCKAVDMKPLAEWFNILADHAKAVDDWKLLLNTARILFATGDIPGAIALLDRADALDRTRLEPWLIKVQLLMTQGDFTLAQKCLLDLEGPERRPVKYQTEMIAKLEADVAEKLQKH